MRRVRYTVVFEKHEDGYLVLVPALPGLVTGGRTLPEARRMAADAIRCHCESLLKDGIALPPDKGPQTEKVLAKLGA